ncbi:MAG: DUF1844 domain-containing protein [Phycisphaerales bacterium]
MATLIIPGGGDSAGKPNSSGPGAGTGSPSAGVAPQLQVDSDWKAQAQAERERLAKAEEERAAKATGTAGAAGGSAQAGAAAGAGEMAAPDFRSLVDMLAMQAVMYMGGMADRNSGRAVFDPEYSRHMIDLLGVLEEKTRGNLAADETQDLKLVLNELRLRYVELMKMVAQQAASKGVSAASLGGGGAMAGGVAGTPGISASV